MVRPVRSGGNSEASQVTRLADVPLSAPGQALIEANLLGWGLVGCGPGTINMHLDHWEATLQVSVPDGPGVQHMTFELGGVILREAWLEARSDGTGRNHLIADDEMRRRAHDVRLDLAHEPGSERLRRIIARMPLKQARWPPLHNALAAGSLLHPARPDLSALTPLRRQVGPGTAGSSIQALGISSQIFALKQRLRHEWAITALDAAALMVAAQVPLTCSQVHSADGDATWRIYSQYLAATLRGIDDGPQRAVAKLVTRAARDGYHDALDALASSYYSTALQFRDAALDGPPDAMRFAWQLYNVAPYAYAVVLISRSVRATLRKNSARSEAWAHRQTAATELFLRVGDGIFYQYLDFCLGCLKHERARVATAQARGDRRGVWKLVRDGEFMLRWPRAYRPYLMGRAGLPAVHYPNEGETY